MTTDPSPEHGDGLVHVEHPAEGVTRIALNRPEHGNRLSGALLAELARRLHALDGERDARVLLLAGRGADFSLGREPAHVDGVPHPDQVVAEFERVQGVNELIQGFPGVTVAVLRGRALGAGASLAGRCDLVVAADTATLGFPEVPQGIAPTVVSSYFVHRLPRTALLDLILTGRTVDAVEAQRMGLVSRVVPEGDLDRAALELATWSAAHDHSVVREVKRFIDQAQWWRPNEAARHAVATLANRMAVPSEPSRTEGAN